MWPSTKFRRCKLHFRIIGAEKFTNKDDVRSDRDKIGNGFPRESGVPLSCGTVRLMLVDHVIGAERPIAQPLSHHAPG